MIDFLHDQVTLRQYIWCPALYFKFWGRYVNAEMLAFGICAEQPSNCSCFFASVSPACSFSTCVHMFVWACVWVYVSYTSTSRLSFEVTRGQHPATSQSYPRGPSADSGPRRFHIAWASPDTHTPHPETTYTTQHLNDCQLELDHYLHL